MTTQKSENLKVNGLEDRQVTKRPFFEPQISEPVDVLEATAFFQLTTGGTDAPPTDDI